LGLEKFTDTQAIRLKKAKSPFIEERNENFKEETEYEKEGITDSEIVDRIKKLYKSRQSIRFEEKMTDAQVQLVVDTLLEVSK
jgi:hypothetical protein